MVGFKKLGWVPEQKQKLNKLGILSFETAKTMSRLISLYKSLSDEEISRLSKNVIKSEGVAFLNSRDEAFLLSLACAERLEDLDRAAASVSRLGNKCNDLGLNRFDLVYMDLKLGLIDIGKSGYGSRLIERKVHKMEKLVSNTSCLHAALEVLAEMEVSERKMKLWKNKPGQLQNANFDLFDQKIDYQRREVRHFREISLWCKTFDKSVGLMAKIVCVAYLRICHVYRPYMYYQILRDYPLILPVKEQIIPHSAPITSSSKRKMVRFYSRRMDEDDVCLYGRRVDEDDVLGEKRNNRVFHSAGPSTVGGSGLALRYANVIILAEKYSDSSASIDHDSRDSLYEMLPENLKSLVRTKLSKNMKLAEDDLSLAEGWREAMKGIMGWLGPMAHKTVIWQMERNFEKMKFSAKPTVLLLETLHFSDKEKTEAAIVEVLVALSCIYRFENRLVERS